MTFFGNGLSGLGETADQLMVRVANGDVSAIIAAAQSSDPTVATTGQQYLARLISGSDSVDTMRRLLFGGQIPFALWQHVTGVDPTTSDWYRYKVGGDVLGAVFVPGYGSYGTVTWDQPSGNNPRVQFPSGRVVGWSWVNPDLSGIHAAMLEEYNRDPSIQALHAPAATTTIAPTQEQVVQAAADTRTPPAGWRAGTMNGTAGYWAPDGLFYTGSAPWTAYQAGTGQSVTPPAPAVIAPLVPGSGTGHDGDAGVPVPTETPTTPQENVTTDIPSGYTTDGSGGQPVDTGLVPVTSAPLSAGVGSGALLLGAAAIGAYLLFGRKH